MLACRKVASLLVALCFTTVLAQATTCGTMVQQALMDVKSACAAIGRNQACYGNITLQATPRAGVANFTFTKTGDLANVADIDTLRLSALDSADKSWGIALMKLQANLPDTLPGQNVTFLLFGNVQIQNAVTAAASPVTVQLTTKGNANIRTSPSTSGQVAGSASKGDTLIADGRNADSTWLRIQIPDSSSLGWIFASLVTPTSDVSALSVVASTEAQTTFTPMQAIYFQSGITQPKCEQAPPDGLLIQTPQGAGRVDLRANDVDIQLGSTAFLQAQPGGVMTVSVVEGLGRVTAQGVTRIVPAGAQVTVPIDASLHASGVPGNPQPYDATLVALLPVQDLPLAITIAPPITAEQLAAAQATPTPSLPSLPAILGSDGRFRGFSGDMAVLNGKTVAQFCPIVGQYMSSQGVTKAQYLVYLQQSLSQVDAQTKEQDIEFSRLLATCP